MKTVRTLLCIALAAVAMMSSCSRRTKYNHYVSTPLSGWEKNDTLAFGVPPVDSTAMYALWLGLRVTESYPFTALTLIVEQRVLPKDTLVTDTVRCQLTDRRGNAVGKGVAYHQYRYAVSHIGLEHGDSVFVRVRHDMKREILPGISDVGVVLRRE